MGATGRGPEVLASVAAAHCCRGRWLATSIEHLVQVRFSSFVRAALAIRIRGWRPCRAEDAACGE